MKRLIAFIVLLAAGGGGAYWYFVAQKPVEKPQVLTATVSTGNIIEAVQTTGTLEPLRRVDVGSQVSGQVQEMYVDFNDIVRQGQLLAKIDPTLLQTQVAIQEANVERQKTDIASQEVQLEDLKRQLERTRQMHARQLQNDQQLEQAELAVKTRAAQIESAKKQLIQADTNLNQAKLNVSYTDIISPIDGVVVERRLDKGQTVQSSMNSPSFFILATDLRTLRLTAGVDEAEIGRIRRGQQVIFTVDTYGQREFVGEVESVRLNAVNQNNVVTYPVRITVQNPDLSLRTGQTANARIIISRADNVVRVPNAALRWRPTNEIYAALGLEAPAPGQGRAGRGGDVNGDVNGAASGAARGGREGGASAQVPARGAAPAAGSPAADAARPGGPSATPAAGVERGAQPGGGRGEGRRQPGQGFGAQAGGELDPEAMARMRERFGGRGGRGGESMTGGRGQGGGNRGAAPVRVVQPTVGQKIDDLFSPIQRQIRPGRVWTWNEEAKELKSIDVRLGIDDNTFSELVSGDVKPGMQIVTGVILPQARANQMQNNNLFNMNQRGGPGMMPGGFSGGGGDRGGGGGGGRGGGGR